MRRAGFVEQPVAEEPLDVVALVGRPVTPDVDAVLVHRVDEQRARDGAAERRRVEVRLAGVRDVEGPALQGDEPLVHELRAAVHDLRRLGAVGERALGDVGDVDLVDLPEIGGERVRDPALLADPGNGDGRVEAAREGDPDAFADGQRLEDSTHAEKRSRRSTGRTAGDRLQPGSRVTAPPRRQPRSSSAGLNAPSRRVRTTPVRSTTNVNGSLWRFHSFTQRFVPFAGSLSR